MLIRAYDALHFHTGVAKINILKVLFGGGVTKKSTLCTLLIMLRIMSPKSTFSKYSFGRDGVTRKSTQCTLLIMLIIVDDP